MAGLPELTRPGSVGARARQFRSRRADRYRRPVRRDERKETLATLHRPNRTGRRLALRRTAHRRRNLIVYLRPPRLHSDRRPHPQTTAASLRRRCACRGRYSNVRSKHKVWPSSSLAWPRAAEDRRCAVIALQTTPTAGDLAQVVSEPARSRSGAPDERVDDQFGGSGSLAGLARVGGGGAGSR